MIESLLVVQEGKRMVSVGPKLSIPETYEGYWEILSEDGKSVRCIGRTNTQLDIYPLFLFKKIYSKNLNLKKNLS